jgi:hypothetical protein
MNCHVTLRGGADTGAVWGAGKSDATGSWTATATAGAALAPEVTNMARRS